jgi:hypothetical protein
MYARPIFKTPCRRFASGRGFCRPSCILTGVLTVKENGKMHIKFYPKGSTVPVVIDLGEADCAEISGISAQSSYSGRRIPLKVHVQSDAVVTEMDMGRYLDFSQPEDWKILTSHEHDAALADFDSEYNLKK